MEKIVIGINQRIPMNMLELALRASMEEDATTDYFRELAAMEYNGQNRIGKTVVVLNRLTKLLRRILLSSVLWLLRLCILRLFYRLSDLRLLNRLNLLRLNIYAFNTRTANGTELRVRADFVTTLFTNHIFPPIISADKTAVGITDPLS